MERYVIKVSIVKNTETDLNLTDKKSPPFTDFRVSVKCHMFM